jgi:amidophosphoribosyltransferase
MVVSCPPTRHACYYGIDFPTDSQLIAAGHTINEVCEFIGLDSLTYLSLEGMVEATGLSRDHFCLACYTGEYIIEPVRNSSKDALEGVGTTQADPL